MHYIVIDQKNNIRISLQSGKSFSENREKFTGLLLSFKNTTFEFRSLLGFKSVLNELEYATLLTFQEAFDIYSKFFFRIYPTKQAFVID